MITIEAVSEIGESDTAVTMTLANLRHALRTTVRGRDGKETKWDRLLVCPRSGACRLVSKPVHGIQLAVDVEQAVPRPG